MSISLIIHRSFMSTHHPIVRYSCIFFTNMLPSSYIIYYIHFFWHSTFFTSFSRRALAISCHSPKHRTCHLNIVRNCQTSKPLHPVLQTSSHSQGGARQPTRTATTWPWVQYRILTASHLLKRWHPSRSIIATIMSTDHDQSQNQRRYTIVQHP